MGGITILRVDLTQRRIEKELAAEDEERKFIGGVGVAHKLIWDEASPDISPFAPENKLIFSHGPLTGTKVPGAIRTIILAKSPHVYPEPCWITSSFGGSFSGELRNAGYEVVVIEGKAETPSYLFISPKKVEIKSAEKMWGLDTFETQQAVKKELGNPQVKVACIGPAGENLIRFSCIVHETAHAAALGGFGAVMGSKNLKAIAIQGEKREIKIERPKHFAEALKEANYLLTYAAQNPKGVGWKKGVDPYLTAFGNQWQRYDSLQMFAPDLLRDERVIHKGNASCPNCPIACHEVFDVPSLNLKNVRIKCMGYLNSLIGKGGSETVAVKDYADRVGMDVKELSLMIPWVRSLEKDGILNEADTGLPFSSFPEKNFVLTFMKKVAARESIGEILAEGVARAAERLGVFAELVKKDTGDLAEFYTCPVQLTNLMSGYGGKGFPRHFDPRDSVVCGLLWAMHPRDPFTDHHEYAYFQSVSGLTLEEQKAIAAKIYGSPETINPPGKSKYDRHEAEATIIVQNRSYAKNLLSLCEWIWPMSLSPFEDRNPPYIGDTSLESRLLSAVKGWDMSEQELNRAGERLFNLLRVILVRDLGKKNIRNVHDTLPEHLFNKPNPVTKSPALNREKFENVKTLYYQLRGWDPETGIPRDTTLHELDLTDVAERLKSLTLLS